MVKRVCFILHPCKYASHRLRVFASIPRDSLPIGLVSVGDGELLRQFFDLAGRTPFAFILRDARVQQLT